MLQFPLQGSYKWIIIEKIKILGAILELSAK